LNNGGIPGKPADLSVPATDDIPEAMRDTPDVKPKSRLKLVLLIVGVFGVGAIALGFGLLFFQAKPPSNVASSSTPATTDNQTKPSNAENLLGHLAYKEAPASELQPITADGGIKMRTAAAQKFQEMSAAAANAGIIISPLSGFRSVTEQQQVFFDVKAERGQVATKRAEVSAPPGYSEHHTGYAVDIGDGNTPATNLSQDFEKTAAFQWLEKNAAFYSFELSFPKGNTQGVSYEPWHWRFVGNLDSLETFYKAKNLTTPSSTPSPTSSSTPSSTPSPTSSSTPSSTPSPTSSSTPSSTPSPTSSSTPSSTPSPTSSSTPSSTPSPTESPTP
jgi:D-alanyl-D-alanine carboxypeptidase